MKSFVKLQIEELTSQMRVNFDEAQQETKKVIKEMYESKAQQEAVLEKKSVQNKAI